MSLRASLPFRRILTRPSGSRSTSTEVVAELRAEETPRPDMSLSRMPLAGWS